MKKRWWIAIGIFVLLIIFGYLFLRGSYCQNNMPNDNINGINKNVKESIGNLFVEPNKKITIYPDSREIYLNQGARGEGFAFSIRNNYQNNTKFRYSIEADPDNNFEVCNINKAKADGYLLIKTGNLNIPSSRIIENPELITFRIPEDANVCEISYKVNVYSLDPLTAKYTNYSTDSIFIHIIEKPTKLEEFKKKINNYLNGLC